MSWPSRRPERSSPLHNFSLPPCLKCGTQKILRCMKSSSASPSLRRSNADDSSSEKPGSQSASATASAANDDIEAVREKLMRDLRMAAKRIMLRSSDEVEEEDREGSLDESAAAPPWNLRTRKAACRASGDCGGGGGERNRVSSLSPPMRQEKGSTRLRNSEKGGRAKFSVRLSKEEVELDYLVMVGNRPPRRPKKRPRILQKQLELVFPGSWLTEITIDRYRVPDVLELAKA